MRPGSVALARLAAALAAVLALACGGSHASWKPSETSRYDQLSEDEAIRFDGACRALERGELERAHELLVELAQRHPVHVAIGLWLQEAQLERLIGEGRTREEALGALRERWLEQALARPSPRSWVLAARLAPTAQEALVEAGRALELDPLCAWAHYARANVLMGERRWSEAREAIAAALRAEPGHLRARRLEAAMIARAGAPRAGREAYEGWLEHAREEPTLDRRMIAGAEIDLALLELLDEEPRAARERLEELGPLSDDPAEEARRLLALAACHQALDDIDAALDAARKAQDVAPRGTLGLVQEALLLERWRERPAEAAEVWREVVELSREEGELSALLERMRAQVHLERARASEPEAQEP